MAEFQDRYPENVPGKFYVDATCTDCWACCGEAPEHFARNDALGHAYVHRQAETPVEADKMQWAVEACPQESIGNDGDRFDWQSGQRLT